MKAAQRWGHGPWWTLEPVGGRPRQQTSLNLTLTVGPGIALEAQA